MRRKYQAVCILPTAGRFVYQGKETCISAMRLYDEIATNIIECSVIVERFSPHTVR